MAISEAKKKIVIDNYFKKECDVNTSIKEAFIKGFELGLRKAPIPQPRKGHWISHREHCEMNNLLPSGLGSYFWCSECDCGIDSKDFTRVNYNYCPNCGADMREDKE